MTDDPQHEWKCPDCYVSLAAASELTLLAAVFFHGQFHGLDPVEIAAAA